MIESLEIPGYFSRYSLSSGKSLCKASAEWICWVAALASHAEIEDTVICVFSLDPSSTYLLQNRSVGTSLRLSL
jgi:hypothetical protein